MTVMIRSASLFMYVAHEPGTPFFSTMSRKSPIFLQP